MSGNEPRIRPLMESELTERQQAKLDDIAQGGGPPAQNLYRTMMRHERLFNRWMALNGSLLLRSSLAPRPRELVILRVAFHSESDYEWEQHVVIGRQSGLADVEIARVREPGLTGAWGPEEALLLQAVDELCSGLDIADSTWESLASSYSELQLFEIIGLVGVYRGLAMFLRTLRVVPEGEEA
jgi:alkylhydroperoxidase family enzyme